MNNKNDDKNKPKRSWGMLVEPDKKYGGLIEPFEPDNDKKRAGSFTNLFLNVISKKK